MNSRPDNTFKNDSPIKDRHILLSLDESENSRRALVYTADILGGSPGFRATLLHIIPEPPEDYFENDKEKNEWFEKESSRAENFLNTCKNLLLDSGFENSQIETLVEIRKCITVADCIMEVQKRLDCCTIIVGRRGISKKEEFIFGSTSSKLLHSQKNCAIWVVE